MFHRPEWVGAPSFEGNILEFVIVDEAHLFGVACMDPWVP